MRRDLSQEKLNNSKSYLTRGGGFEREEEERERERER